MAKDIVYTADGPLIENGDFVVAESTQQEIDHILRIPSGALRHEPRIGVFALRFVKSRSFDQLRRDIHEHLSRDGKTPRKLEVKDNNITIEL